MSEFCVDMNATRAAKAAGYHPKMGAKLVAHPGVKVAIATKTAIQLAAAEQRAAEIAEASAGTLRRIDLTAEAVKTRLGLLAFQDIRKMFDERGNLRPLHELDDDTAPMVAGMEVIIKNAEAGDGHTDRVHKIRIVDQVKPLEILARHFGLLVEQAPIPVNVTFVWQTQQS